MYYIIKHNLMRVKMKVLLVIDMQKGFIKNKDYQKLSDKIERLVSNGVYDKIIFTKFINDITKNSFYEDKIGWRELKTKEEQGIVLNIPEHSI